MTRTCLFGLFLLVACGGSRDIGLQTRGVSDRSGASGYVPAASGARLIAVHVRMLNASRSPLPIGEANFFLEQAVGSNLRGHPSTASFSDGCVGELAPGGTIDCAVGFDVSVGFVPVQIAYQYMDQRAVAPVSLTADGGVPEFDAGPYDAGPPPPRLGRLDLLFMVDNSNSMNEEQASLMAEFPRLMNILASGDFDQDGDDVTDGEPGDLDFEPIADLRVGVITSDMGTGGFRVPTCARSDFGDDGILRTQGRADIPGCMATYPSFLSYSVGGAMTPAQLAADVACVATVGTGGCGFEQQLEATLKGLSPSAPTSWTADGYVAPTFFRNTFGHADAVNDGFIRDNSVLAIILLSDEEDCSAQDPELFNPSSAIYGGTDLNLRCFAHADAALHPISRFVDGLAQLRRSTGRLVFAPVVGIPVDLAPSDGAPVAFGPLVSIDPAIRDPRMQERVDPSMASRLIPSCNVPGRGMAFPPVRIVQVAEQLEERGARVTVQSICQESYQGAMEEIVRQIRAAGA